MTFPELAQRLIDFVLRDDRFRQVGVRGGADLTFRELCGRAPIKEEVNQVLRHFWQIWHERFDQPPPAAPFGCGSPYHIREDASSWQENAIRALEESI